MPEQRERWVPVSVRYGNRRKKVGWWLLGCREWLALRLAPWLRSRAQMWADVIPCPRCTAGCFQNGQGWWCGLHGLVRWPSGEPRDG